MKYKITHTTRYKASNRVSVCHNAAWLTPRATQFQQVEQHEISIDPQPSTLETLQDSFGNTVTFFSLNEGYKSLKVSAASSVNVHSAIEKPEQSAPWESVARSVATHQSPSDLAALQFRYDSPRSHRLQDATKYARESFTAGRPMWEALYELTSRIHTDFEYDPKSTTVTTPTSKVMQQRRGVCQDFAHLQIAMLRSLGLAARYVSGYLRTYAAPGQPRLVGVDASHAWLSVYCGDLGWLDVDPTNNKLVGEEYITVAWGRDYGDVTPLKGVYTGGGKHTLSVSVDVAPVEDN